MLTVRVGAIRPQRDCSEQFIYTPRAGLGRNSLTVEEILEAVLSIEERARAMIDAASQESKKILAAAQVEAQRVRTEGQQKAERRADRMKSTSRRKIDKERERIINEAEMRVKQLEITAKANMEQAVLFVIDWITGVKGSLQQDDKRSDSFR